MRATPLQTDFSTGEISPLAMGRTDMDRFKAALAKCLNAIPVAAGPVFRRSGSNYIVSTKFPAKKTLLIPFKFNNTTGYALEVGHYYTRLFYNGAPVQLSGSFYEPGFYGNYGFTYSPWSEDDLSDLAWTQSGDILYVVHPLHPPVKIERFGNTDWRMQYMSLKQGPWLETQAPSWQLSVVTHYVLNGITYVRLQASGVVGLNTFTVTNLYGSTYKVVNNAPHGLNIGDNVGQYVTGTTYNTWIIQDVPDPNTIVVTGTAPGVGISISPVPFTVDDQYGRMIYFKVGSTWYRGEACARPSGMATSIYDSGYAQVFRLDVDVAAGSASSFWKFSAYWGYPGVVARGTGYPSAVTFHEDRLAFGGPLQQVFLSRTSDYENFFPINSDGSVPGDAAIFFNIPVGGIDPIRWLVSDEKGLQIGTSGGEFWLKGGSQYEALSDTNISFKQSTAFGSNTCLPVKAGKNTLFVDPTGKKVRELAYFYNIDGYDAVDLSVISEHITQAGVKQLVFQKAPFPIVWAVLEDGTLAGLSYQRDVDALRAGWHVQIIGGVSDVSGTQAKVETVAVIPNTDGKTESLYMVVERRINGATTKYVEYLSQPFLPSVADSDAHFLDAALSFSGAPTTSVTGLGHLEGQTVKVFADGAYAGSYTVTAGAITLAAPASKILVGLGYTTRVQLCRKDVGSQDGSALGKKQRTNQVAAEFYRTAGVKMGTDFTNMDDCQFEGAPAFFSGTHEQQLQSSHSTNSRVCIEVTDPTPMMLLSISSQVVTNDKG